MQIILLSGGSGKRLWPLSNNTRSKQFLKLLAVPDEKGSHNNSMHSEANSAGSYTSVRESMVQRVIRQVHESGIEAQVTVATSLSQKDVIINQLGENVQIVTEPERRDTFPAIALASSYLSLEKKCSRDEVVVVMPCDPYTESGYFETIGKMAKAVQNGLADLVLMGIEPTYPSSKYGYIVPGEISSCHCERNEMECGNLGQQSSNESLPVARFTEKPTEEVAKELISQGAFWNGGVFAFKLGYLMDIVDKYCGNPNQLSFAQIRDHYCDFPKISFDYEVVEKAKSVAAVVYSGKWVDLGTWNTLTEELNDSTIGNAILVNSDNTHIINELEIPIMCIGGKDLVVAASPDGILISDKKQSEKIKPYADKLISRPMYEERRWGEYKVIDEITHSDGSKSLTKQVIVKPNNYISYQSHNYRDEVWTFLDGEGLLVIEDKITKVQRGDTISISKATKHGIKAISNLRFIEVQSGTKLDEEDVVRYEWNWN